MSDMTDDLYFDEDWVEENVPKHVQLMQLQNKELVEKALASDFDPSPKIDSICEYFTKKKTLSDKQRWCLAYFIAYGTDKRQE